MGGRERGKEEKRESEGEKDTEERRNISTAGELRGSLKRESVCVSLTVEDSYSQVFNMFTPMCSTGACLESNYLGL